MTKLLASGVLVGLGWLGAWAWYFDDLRRILEDFLQALFTGRALADMLGLEPMTVLAALLVMPAAMAALGMAVLALKNRTSSLGPLNPRSPYGYPSSESAKAHRYKTGL